MQTQVVLPLFENDYIGIKLPFTCTCWTGLDKQHFIKHPSWIVDAYLAALSHSIITFCIKELRKTSQGHSWCNIGISSLCCCCDRPSVRLESQNQSFKSQMQRHLRANWTQKTSKDCKKNGKASPGNLQYLRLMNFSQRIYNQLYSMRSLW